MAVKGLTQTSGIITVSASVQETAANTFTQQQIDLSLDALNQEVFIVIAVDLNPQFPDAITSTNTATQAAVSTTTRTTLGFIEDTNVLASNSTAIRAAGFGPGDGGIGFTQTSLETPPSNLEYIGIIATSNVFLAVQGSGNLAAKGVGMRMWGYRARASGSIYAALIQSEVLSA